MHKFRTRSVKAALIGTTAAVAMFAGANAASANVWNYQGGNYYSLAACQTDGRYGVAHFGWTSYACQRGLNLVGYPPVWELYSLD
jgi:hypothetical protein